MVELENITAYVRPGTLLKKSREAFGSDSSAKAYDNVPKTPPLSRHSEALSHGNDESAKPDSDGERLKNAV